MPEDPATLKALLRAARAERDRERQRADEHAARALQQAQRAEAQEALAREKSALAAQQGKRADDLYVQTLRLQLELERYKKWYYGPRADRLQSSGELGQALLNFGEELEQQPVHPDDGAAGSEPATEGRRVKRRRGRRALANFENLPVTTQVYELSGKERACPCCGVELADRVPSRALRAHPACAQEVRLRALRSFRGEAADSGGGAGGVAARARPGG